MVGRAELRQSVLSSEGSRGAGHGSPLQCSACHDRAREDREPFHLSSWRHRVPPRSLRVSSQKPSRCCTESMCLAGLGPGVDAEDKHNGRGGPGWRGSGQRSRACCPARARSVSQTARVPGWGRPAGTLRPPPQNLPENAAWRVPDEKSRCRCHLHPPHRGHLPSAVSAGGRPPPAPLGPPAGPPHGVAGRGKGTAASVRPQAPALRCLVSQRPRLAFGPGVTLRRRAGAFAGAALAPLTRGGVQGSLRPSRSVRT